MKSEEIRLVREFASETPPLEEETKRHAYLHATGREGPRVRRWPSSNKRVKYFAAIALACTAAVIATVFLTEGRAPANQLGSSALGVSSLPTVDRPLPAGSHQVSLPQAANVLGASLTLPNSARVSSADAGAVWSSRAAHSPVGGSVAVTFPSQGFAVRYTRPVPYQDPLANYESYVQSTPSAQVVYLDGVPTLTDTSSRPDGSTWNSVEFVSHGTMIALMGTADQSTLQDAARSILSQMG